MRVVLLAGGTGAAKLAEGLQAELPPGDLTVVANTADDVEAWDLRVSPDLDAVLYRLAGLFDERSGFGVRGDGFAALEMMERLGEPAWFRLGDRDLAVQVLRTSLLRRGARLSEAALELGRRLGIPSRVLPMSDDDVRTIFVTEAGRLGFQEYFVRERCGPRVLAIELAGADTARPSPEAASALEEADLVVIGPSNPLISIAPILRVLGGSVRPERTVAVSPIVAGRSLKGPTVEMMSSLGKAATAAGVAVEYRETAGWYVLDEADAALRGEVARLGLRPLVTRTVMADAAAARRLAAAILEAVGLRT